MVGSTINVRGGVSFHSTLRVSKNFPLFTCLTNYVWERNKLLIHVIVNVKREFHKMSTKHYLCSLLHIISIKSLCLVCLYIKTHFPWCDGHSISISVCGV